MSAHQARPMTRFILLSLFAALLAGCTSAKDVAQRNEERCLARGLQPKTDNFQNCINQLENERDTRMETRRREQLEQSAAPPSNRGY
jgi:hypothetical protein